LIYHLSKSENQPKNNIDIKTYAITDKRIVLILHYLYQRLLKDFNKYNEIKEGFTKQIKKKWGKNYIIYADLLYEFVKLAHLLHKMEM
jgi:hypothetical protein